MHRRMPRRTTTILPRGVKDAVLRLGRREVRVTNLDKVFWPELGITKGALIEYYVSVAEYLLPHVRDRAMVMKRYPNGAAGDFFFMKRAPTPRPAWIETCTIDHGSGNVIDFPMIQDLASLVWVVNLGCIDLNQWYGRCDAQDRPDYLHFDLDPVDRSVSFARLSEAALLVHEALETLGMPSLAKTTGSRGIHIYVPIERGPTQHAVWEFTKTLATELASRNRELMTVEYRVARRPAGRVLVDYNQNAWGRTLASIYSVRPTPRATVSMPVTWAELERGIHIEDFHIGNALARLRRRGDLWAPLLAARGRFDLGRFV
jgi:bifunctional non-homologous end joining protein LigD